MLTNVPASRSFESQITIMNRTTQVFSQQNSENTSDDAKEMSKTQLIFGAIQKFATQKGLGRDTLLTA